MPRHPRHNNRVAGPRLADDFIEARRGGPRRGGQQDLPETASNYNADDEHAAPRHREPAGSGTVDEDGNSGSRDLILMGTGRVLKGFCDYSRERLDRLLFDPRGNACDSAGPANECSSHGKSHSSHLTDLVSTWFFFLIEFSFIF